MNRLRRPSPRPRRQRGAALLTAMIIVTLVATLASAMVWQQWRAVQVEASERSRSQAAWVLTGALDFAKLILVETANKKGISALTDPWATPLEESRISTFLAVDKSNADDGPEAFLSGYIEDAQGRYNLDSLVANGSVDPNQLEVLKRLCEAVHIESGIAERIASGLLSATQPKGASTPLLPSTVAQLTWLGIDQASVQALQPYVVLFQRSGTLQNTSVNVNTAPAEVLAAVANLDPGTAEHIVQVRQSAPFSTVQAFLDQAPATKALSATAVADLKTHLDVTSAYFQVHGRLRLADRVLVETSLVTRGTVAGQYIVLDRQRAASVE